MSQLEGVNKAIRQLKGHLECLLIRMSSCQQFIEKIFKIIYEGGDSTSRYPKSSARSIQKQIDDSEIKNKYQENSPSIKQFLLFHPTEVKSKSLDTNSFTLMKNAILVNSHEIQEIQTKLSDLQPQNYYEMNQQGQKIKKLEEAVDLLTNLVHIIDKKISPPLPSVLKKSKEKGKNKSINKKIKITDYGSL